MTTTETAEARARIERQIAWMNDDAGGNMPVGDEHQVTVRLGDLRLLLASLTPPAQGGEWVSSDQIDAWIEEIGPACVECLPHIVRSRKSAMRRLADRILSAIPDASPGSEDGTSAQRIRDGLNQALGYEKARNDLAAPTAERLRSALERFDAHVLAIADRKPSAKRDELLSELQTIRNSMCRAALSDAGEERA